MFSWFGSFTGDFPPRRSSAKVDHPICNAPMLGAHRPVHRIPCLRHFWHFGCGAASDARSKRDAVTGDVRKQNDHSRPQRAISSDAWSRDSGRRGCAHSLHCRLERRFESERNLWFVLDRSCREAGDYFQPPTFFDFALLYDGTISDQMYSINRGTRRIRSCLDNRIRSRFFPFEPPSKLKNSNRVPVIDY